MTNENDYEPEVLEPIEIVEPPDNIFDDLRTASGKSITEIAGEWDLIEDDTPQDDEEDTCGDYPDCDDQFTELFSIIDELTNRIVQLERAVFKRIGPPLK